MLTRQNCKGGTWGHSTSSLQSDSCDTTAICASSFVICCNSLLFFSSSSLNCVWQRRACSWWQFRESMRQWQSACFVQTDRQDNPHCCTCTWQSSSVKAISVMSEGGCSVQMFSELSFVPFRWSGLARATRRVRKLCDWVGVVRIC